MSSFYKYCDALATFPDSKHGPRVDTILIGDERVSRETCMDKWSEGCRTGIACDAPAQKGVGSNQNSRSGSSAAASELDMEPLDVDAIE